MRSQADHLSQAGHHDGYGNSRYETADADQVRQQAGGRGTEEQWSVTPASRARPDTAGMLTSPAARTAA